MAFSVIVHTQQEANRIAQHFGIPKRRVLNGHVLGHKLENGVYFLSGSVVAEKEPITPQRARCVWPEAYIQAASVPTGWFIEALEPFALERKEQLLRIARRWMARYPELVFDLTECKYTASLSVALDTRRAGVPLHDYFLARKRLEEYRFETFWGRAFDGALPNLHVRVFRGFRDGYEVQAWIRRAGRSAEHTGWEAKLPLTVNDIGELGRLNAEAGKALQPGWFFCTHCQTAKPRTEYRGFYFADTRCKACVTPEWSRAARSETYD